MNLTTLVCISFCLMCSVFANSARAQDNLYQCTVKQVLELNDAGVLVPIRAPGVTHIGDTFTINRTTGEVWGKWINTRYAESFVLVDKGGSSSSNSLKISGVIKHWHPTLFSLTVVDHEKKQTYAFSGYFKYNHIAGTCN